MKRILVVMALLAGSLIGFTTPVLASAGYYPVNKGEILEATTCIPSTTKPPVLLQISGVNTNQKKVEITRATKWSKTKTSTCGTNEYQVTFKWIVNRTGAYALWAYAPNSPVDLYVWPDGIDIPDQSTSNSSSKQGTSTSTTNELTDKQITSIMAKCVKKNIKRANSGENLLDQGFLDVTMAILSDCIESTNSNIRCALNNREITVCGLIGKRTGISLPAVMGNVLTGKL